MTAQVPGLVEDPAAVAAAQWALRAQFDSDKEWPLGSYQLRVRAAAAAQALAPVRRLHRKVKVAGQRAVCETCWDSMGNYMLWPCKTAMAVYSDEELAQ